MSTTHNCPCTQACPLQRAMEMIGGKWKLSLLCSLMVAGTIRYNALRAKLDGVSNTVLSAALKELEADGLVHRQVYPQVPIRVEYATTEKAKALGPILVQLAQWAAGM